MSCFLPPGRNSIFFRILNRDLMINKSKGALLLQKNEREGAYSVDSRETWQLGREGRDLGFQWTRVVYVLVA